MPIQQIGILPQFNNINPSTISVPSNVRVPDSFNTHLAVHQELRAREVHQMNEDKFEMEKLQQREDVRNTALGYIMSQGGGGGGRSQGRGRVSVGASGLTGYTPYSRRIMEEMGGFEQQAIEDIYGTDDPQEMQKRALQYRSRLQGNGEYQAALRQEAAIEQKLEIFRSAKPGVFDPEAVRDAIAGLENIDPITGNIKVPSDNEAGFITLSPDEYLNGINYEPFSAVKFEADLEEQLGGQDFVDEVTLSTGSTAVAKGKVFDDEKTRILKIQNMLDATPKATRHYRKKFGLSDINEDGSPVTSAQIAQLMSDSFTPIGELQEDGTIRQNTSLTNLETLQDKENIQAQINQRNRANRGSRGGNASLKDRTFAAVFQSLINDGVGVEEATRRAAAASSGKADPGKSGNNRATIKNGNVESMNINGYEIDKKSFKDVEGISFRNVDGTATLEIKINSKQRLQWLKDNNLAPEGLSRLDRHDNYDAASGKVIFSDGASINSNNNSPESTSQQNQRAASAGILSGEKVNSTNNKTGFLKAFEDNLNSNNQQSQTTTEIPTEINNNEEVNNISTSNLSSNKLTNLNQELKTLTDRKNSRSTPLTGRSARQENNRINSIKRNIETEQQRLNSSLKTKEVQLETINLALDNEDGLNIRGDRGINPTIRKIGDQFLITNNIGEDFIGSREEAVEYLKTFSIS